MKTLFALVLAIALLPTSLAGQQQSPLSTDARQVIWCSNRFSFLRQYQHAQEEASKLCMYHCKPELNPTSFQLARARFKGLAWFAADDRMKDLIDSGARLVEIMDSCRESHGPAFTACDAAIKHEQVFEAKLVKELNDETLLCDRFDLH